MAHIRNGFERTYDFGVSGRDKWRRRLFSTGELLESVNVSVLAVASFIWHRSRTVFVHGDVGALAVLVVVMVPIIVVSMLAARKLSVGMTMGQHDFTNAMAGAAFMSMSRRSRHDAKLRHGSYQQPSQEATKHDHRFSLNACFLPLLEADHREYGVARYDASRFPQHASSHLGALTCPRRTHGHVVPSSYEPERCPRRRCQTASPSCRRRDQHI